MSDRKDLSLAEPGVTDDAGDYVRYLEKELAQARKLEEVGMLAGVVAHDLNNILTPVFGYATILKRDLEQDHPLTKAVGVIEKSAERAANLISKMLGCARQQGIITIPFDIIAMLDKFLESLNSQGILIEKNYSDVPAVLADPHQVAVVIRAVAANALEAMGQSGKLTVNVESIVMSVEFSRHHPPAKPGQHVCITIQDTGHGIPADILEKVYEPFFSTKPTAVCAGIGLTIAHSLLRRNSGCIELNSIEGKGTTVKIHLPAFQPEI
jgi:signal transduction histidine kinase